MEPVFREAAAQLEKDRPFVVASVIRTSGSTPQKPGAKLLVREDGSAVGTLGGGCVEGDIWFAAKTLLREGGPAIVRDYILNEDLAAQDGLVCGGTMYFLIDPTYSGNQRFGTFTADVLKAYEGGRPVAVASLTAGPRGSELSIGAKLLIRENGETVGSLGDPAIDQEAVKRARKLMAMGKYEYAALESGAEFFLEAYTTPPKVVIAGGGHVGRALATAARFAGFKVAVIDDRPEFSSRDRFPDVDEVRTQDFVAALREMPINANTFIVIATRGHRYDDLALEAAAKTRASYVALLGSRRKTVMIYESLLEKGVPPARLREIRAPSGLDIGARTPEEIAISLVAEMLMFRLGGSGAPLKLDDKYLQRIEAKVREPASTT
ncbi:MAG: XdhC family protein [SAR202 cluster bacterium]|nr:XdhC family protein [SAR202 cluster bacterium]